MYSTWWSGVAIIFIYICVSDIKYRTINNRTIALINLWFVGYVLLFSQFQWLTVGTYVFVVLIGVILSYFNMLGAGDSKLMAAISLALTPYQFAYFVLLTFLIGGVLALFYLILSSALKKRVKVSEHGIPYGVAISIAGMFMLAFPF